MKLGADTNVVSLACFLQLLEQTFEIPSHRWIFPFIDFVTIHASLVIPSSACHAETLVQALERNYTITVTVVLHSRIWLQLRFLFLQTHDGAALD
mmetsp:Transcript_5098/g.9758  ORF Transcript_5098/g.9758 Transcript_5098/m.9758 type:complete len:95 (+) Transcript_5098:73-357(+)